jgi:hypothetical protein
MPPPANVQIKNDQSLISKPVPVPKHALVEYVPKHALEKKIEPSQTRFPSSKIVPFQNRGLVLASHLEESETDGSTTDASTDLDAPLRPIDQERSKRQRQNERTQQSYVAMTPLLVPGAAGNESPITTWGTVDSTPMVLSGREAGEKSSSTSFSVPAENERERAARKAESELARRVKRAKSSSKSTQQKKLSLTPAAMALLEKTKRTPSRPRDAFASSLRSSYTPKPRSSSRTHSSSRRTQDSAFNATPLASKHHGEP